MSFCTFSMVDDSSLELMSYSSSVFSALLFALVYYLSLYYIFVPLYKKLCMGGGKYGAGAELDSRVRADNDQIRAFKVRIHGCRAVMLKRTAIRLCVFLGPLFLGLER